VSDRKKHERIRSIEKSEIFFHIPLFNYAIIFYFCFSQRAGQTNNVKNSIIFLLLRLLYKFAQRYAFLFPSTSLIILRRCIKMWEIKKVFRNGSACAKQRRKQIDSVIQCLQSPREKSTFVSHSRKYEPRNCVFIFHTVRDQQIDNSY